MEKLKLDKNPLVTIYLTSHNYAEYISYAIDSILNQTYKNIELIIIETVRMIIH